MSNKNLFSDIHAIAMYLASVKSRTETGFKSPLTSMIGNDVYQMKLSGIGDIEISVKRGIRAWESWEAKTKKLSQRVYDLKSLIKANGDAVASYRGAGVTLIADSIEEQIIPMVSELVSAEAELEALSEEPVYTEEVLIFPADIHQFYAEFKDAFTVEPVVDPVVVPVVAKPAEDKKPVAKKK